MSYSVRFYRETEEGEDSNWYSGIEYDTIDEALPELSEAQDNSDVRFAWIEEV